VPLPKANIKKALLILNTGDGKGKTTAAMGLLMRTLGNGGKCAVFQFIKSSHLKTGERKLAESLNVRWKNFGFGFIRNEKDSQKTAQICKEGWQEVKEAILSNNYNLVVLDEFTYLLTNKFLDEDEVITFFENYKKEANACHVVITGRNATKRLIDVCDLVSEIKEVKHPYATDKLAPQRMIEY
jgi:cob(I)alamin adenosyltransferase